MSVAAEPLTGETGGTGETCDTGEEPARGSWWDRVRVLREPGPVALAVWLVTMPVAFAVPAMLELNPLLQREANLPLAVLFWGLLVIVIVSLRRRGAMVAGAAAGLFASYIALVLRTALSGTPFAFDGVYGDTGRISAMAVRYSFRWATSDGIVPGTPGEYPPLFPYTIGKIALLLDTPAWRLLGPAEVIAVSASVVIAFVLWSRLVPPWAALSICVLLLVAFGKPYKAYEVLALAVFVPLVLLTLAKPPRGRLHWLAAGLLTAVMCLTYYGYVVFSAVGLVALGWWTWRTEADRRAYLRYLLRVLAVVAVATAWYTLPLLSAMISGTQQVADTYQTGRISGSPFPFLELTLLGTVQLIGAVGLLWYSRKAWWATPLLLIVAGGYAYHAIGMVRWVVSGHTSLMYYAIPLISTCLVVAAVLTLREAVPVLAQRMRRSFATHSGVVVIAAVVAFAGFTYWLTWMPATVWYPTADGRSAVDWDGGSRDNVFAANAHLQYFPDGSRPEHAASVRPRVAGDPLRTWRFLPVAAIERAVREVRPGDTRPRVLSYDEQLFAFLSWYGYIGVDRTGTNAPVRWDDRRDELVTISRWTDPESFAQASAQTRFGPIDVFVLRRQGDGLLWQAIQSPSTVRFQRSQFASPHFEVRDLGAETFIAIRRP